MKVRKEHIKYAVVNKVNNSVTLLRFKTKVAELLKVTVKTIDRNPNYENKEYKVITNISLNLENVVRTQNTD